MSVANWTSSKRSCGGKAYLTYARILVASERYEAKMQSLQISCADCCVVPPSAAVDRHAEGMLTKCCFLLILCVSCVYSQLSDPHASDHQVKTHKNKFLSRKATKDEGAARRYAEKYWSNVSKLLFERLVRASRAPAVTRNPGIATARKMCSSDGRPKCRRAFTPLRSSRTCTATPTKTL